MFFYEILIYTLATIFYSIIIVIIPKYLIDQLVVNEYNLNYIVLLLIFFLSVCISGALMTYLGINSDTKIMTMKRYYDEKLYNKILSLKYKYIEDPDFLDKNHLVFAVTEDFNGGLEGVSNVLFKLPANLVITIFLVVLISFIHPVISIAIIIEGLRKFYLSKVNTNYTYDKKQDIGNSKRKMTYFYKTSYDFNYGKDIRIFSIKDIS